MIIEEGDSEDDVELEWHSWLIMDESCSLLLGSVVNGIEDEEEEVGGDCESVNDNISWGGNGWR